jgi:hypothetical protein
MTMVNTMKEKQSAGGFLGINVLAIKDFNICIEEQYTGRFSCRWHSLLVIIGPIETM